MASPTSPQQPSDFWRSRLSSLVATDDSYRIHFVALVVSLIAVMVGSAGVGAVAIPWSAILTGDMTELQYTVFTSIRLPRVLLGGLVGLALGVSGAAMQGLFRNPMADPGLIGVSSGAALTVGLLIVFAGSGPTMFGLYSQSVAAFTGGLITAAIIIQIARTAGNFNVTVMLLVGLAINLIVGASTSYLTFISDDNQLRALTFWAMGSLSGALWPPVIVMATVAIPASLILIRYGGKLNILTLGDSEARHLGVDTNTLKFVVIACSALAVGSAVAVSGLIGFIGLLIPHLARLFVGADQRRVFPCCALMGAILLIGADTLSRLVMFPAELPVGILTSLVGGPFFLWLLIKQNQGRSIF